MIIEIKKITNALAKVSAFASGEKNVPGVLLDIKDNEVHVCYSDGRKSVIEKIEAITGEEDRRGQIVLNYQRLVGIINSCQPTGKIVTDSIELLFADEKTLKIRAEKKIAETDGDSSEVEYRTCSIFEQSISWVEAGADMKVAILSRMNYDSIFEGEEVDEWEIGELRKKLDKASTEKGKVVYMSPKYGSAFVSNTAYFIDLPIEGYTNPMIFTTAMAKSISDILGKISETDKVNVHVVDKRYCCIHTGENTVGIWVEMAAANSVHLSTLGRYRAKGYKSFQLTFIKDILKNVVDSALSTNGADKTVLKFADSKIEDGAKELRIASNNSGASISNTYSVVCVECSDQEDKIDSLELPISLKVLSEMIGKCDNDYVAFDIDLDDTESKIIRLSDIDMESKIVSDNKIRNRLGLGMEESIPLEEKLEHRVDMLGNKIYTISTK